MTSRNDITGDAIRTDSSTDAYRDGWARIFGKKPTFIEPTIAEQTPAPPGTDTIKEDSIPPI
jgi:hypothetical protein